MIDYTIAPEDCRFGELRLDCQLTLILGGQEPAAPLEEGHLWLLPSVDVGHVHQSLHAHLLAHLSYSLGPSDVHILKGIVPSFPGSPQLNKNDSGCRIGMFKLTKLMTMLEWATALLIESSSLSSRGVKRT